MPKWGMRMIKYLLTSCIILLGACSYNAPSPLTVSKLSDPKPLVLLISIDGFKPEYLQRAITPTINQLAQHGAVAKGMLPVFPSVTFPNHYSIVTGLYPDHHGIVNNSMKDSSIREPFKLSSRTAISNPAWWSAGTPIWVSAQQQGLKSSTLFWPGSEAKVQDIQPNDWLYYDKSMNAHQRVEKLTEWLNRPANLRADFATLYFEDVDSAGHRYGPNSSEVNHAIQEVDSEISDLLNHLKTLGLYDQTTLIIVSDHGMAEVPSSNRIQLNDLLRAQKNATVEWQGPLAGINLNGSNASQTLQALQKSPQMSCWPKQQIPTKYHFGHNPRIPDIVCLAQLHWTISEGASLYTILGQHGYDPSDVEMHGLFIASGNRVKKIQLDYFENIEVYPLIAHLLKIQPAKNDAKDDLFKKVIQP
jgi:predicted AlkP superfamily pyrophosphatase or phosphodiesterase